MNDVVWSDEALDQLAAIYVAAASGERDDLAHATDAIDHTLAESGDKVGESRGGDGRVYFHPLLVVFYQVDGPVIRVIEVKANRPRRHPPRT
jgi:plasmid stabilization system protein ParE